ncbi:LbFV_orf92-like primase/helicase [Cotesia congregata filamentous virus 1]|uniref:LbFV_orf92-like primase/helicase n=1 Tax=Cotesia congregata filamentous virus 1 TaxID=3064291 RepID=A0ABC8QJK1_9VIRU|nr:LbFV_orf92-like primase/helicase [Cotesia congregata filamentous virus 1]
MDMTETPRGDDALKRAIENSGGRLKDTELMDFFKTRFCHNLEDAEELCVSVVGSKDGEVFRSVKIRASLFAEFTRYCFLNYTYTLEHLYASGVVVQVYGGESCCARLPYIRLILDVDTDPQLEEFITENHRLTFISQLIDEVYGVLKIPKPQAASSVRVSCKPNSKRFHLYFPFMLDVGSNKCLIRYLCLKYNSDGGSHYKLDLTTNVSMPAVRNHRLLNTTTTDGHMSWIDWKSMTPIDLSLPWYSLSFEQLDGIDSSVNIMTLTMHTVNFVRHADNVTTNRAFLLPDSASSSEQLNAFKKTHRAIKSKEFIKKHLLGFDIIMSNQNVVLAALTPAVLSKLPYTTNDDHDDDERAFFDDVEDTKPLYQKHYYDVFNSSIVKMNEGVTVVSDEDVTMDECLNRHKPKNLNVSYDYVHYSDSTNFPFTEEQLNTLCLIQENKQTPSTWSDWDKKKQVYETIVNNFVGLKSKSLAEESLYLATAHLLYLEADRVNKKLPPGKYNATNLSMYAAAVFCERYISSLSELKTKLSNPKWRHKAEYGLLSRVAEGKDDLTPLQIFQTDYEWLHQSIEIILNLGNVSTMIAFFAVYNAYYTRVPDIILFMLYNFKLSLHAKYILTRWYHINLDQNTNHFARETVFNNTDFLLFGLLQAAKVEYTPGGEKCLTAAFKTFKKLCTDVVVILNQVLYNLFEQNDIPLTKNDKLGLLFDNSEDFEHMLVMRLLGTKSMNEKQILIFSEGGYRQMQKETLHIDFKTMTTVTPPTYVPESSAFSYEWANSRIGLFNAMLQVFELNSPAWKTKVVMTQETGCEAIFQIAWQPFIHDRLFQMHCAIPHFIKRIHVESLLLTLLLPIREQPKWSNYMIAATKKLFDSPTGAFQKFIDNKTPNIIDDLYPTSTAEHTITLDNLNNTQLRQLCFVEDPRYIFNYFDKIDARKPQPWPKLFSARMKDTLDHDLPQLKSVFVYFFLILENLILKHRVVSFTSVSHFIKLFFHTKIDKRSGGGTLKCTGNDDDTWYDTITTFVRDQQKQRFTAATTTALNTDIESVGECSSSSNGGSNIEVDAKDLSTWFYQNLPTLYKDESELSTLLANKPTANTFYNLRNKTINSIIDSALTPSQQQDDEDEDDDDEQNDAPIAGEEVAMEIDCPAAGASVSLSTVFSLCLYETKLLSKWLKMDECRGATLSSKLAEIVLRQQPFDENILARVSLDNVHRYNMAFAVLVVSWFIRMGPRHRHTDSAYFTYIYRQRRLLFKQLRRLCLSLNDGEDFCHFYGMSELVQSFQEYFEKRTFSPHPEFTTRPIFAPLPQMCNVAIRHTDIKDERTVRATFELEKNNSLRLWRLIQRETIVTLLVLVCFSEYNYGVFQDLFKVLMLGTIKGNPTRIFAMIVGITGSGKSTLIRMLESYFTTANSSPKLTTLMISTPPKQDLDAAALPLSSCLLCVSDETKSLTNRRINSLCDEGRIGTRSIRVSEATALRLTAALLLAGNSGFPIDDATANRMLVFIKNYRLASPCTAPIVGLLSSEERRGVMDNIRECYLNGGDAATLSAAATSAASRFAGFQCVNQKLPYVFEESIAGLYNNLMNGRAFFLNTNTLPVDKDFSLATKQSKREYERKYSPRVCFKAEFKIEPSDYETVTKQEFDNTVRLWWTANKHRLFMPDFDANALLQQLEHELLPNLTEDKNYYRIKMTKN